MTNRGLVSISGSTLGRGGRRPQAGDPLGSNDIANRRYADQVGLGLPPYVAALKLKNKYSVDRGIYNFKSSNTRRLDQGRADAMVGGVTRHMVCGDSVSAGCTSGIGTVTYDRAHSWPYMMRDQLAVTGIPANGMGFVKVIDNAVSDDRWTATGTWLGEVNWSFTTTVGSSLSLTVTRPGTILDVWYGDNGSGTFTISINGATSGANFATVTGSGGVALFKKYRMYGVSMGIGSVVKITCTVAGTGVGISGAAIWSPNAGMIVDNCGVSGSTAGRTGTLSWTDFTNTSSPYFVFKDVSGRATTITDAATTAGANTITSASSSFNATGDTLLGEPIDQFPDTLGALFPPNTYITGRTSATVLTTSNNALATATGKTLRIGRDPHAVHIALGGNDIQADGISASSITDAIKLLGQQWPNSDIVLHLQHEVSTTLASSAEEAGFQQALYQLADTTDWVLYDWRDRAGNYVTGFNNGFYQDYQAHLIPGSYADLGSSFAQALGGGSGQPQFWNPPVYDGDLANRKAVLDLGGRTASAANVSVTTTVETVVAKVLIPANTFKVASAIDTSLFMHPSATSITTTRIRIGTAGTISDACVQVVAASSLTNTPSRYVEGVGAVTAIGASAAFIAGGTESMGTASATGISIAASGTFDSTKDNWVSITVQNTSSVTTTVYAARVRVTI